MRSLHRTVRAAAIALTLTALLPASHAAVSCDAPNAAGVQRCRTGLASAQIVAMQRTQEQSLWCWAASIAMVFAHHGFAVRQEDVVRRQFGELVDRAIPGSAITRILANHWHDDGGRDFYAITAVSDKTARRYQLRDASVVGELAEQRPLILGVDGHAMVLVEVEFDRSIRHDEVRIVGGTVIDPEPGKGVRSLMRAELAPSYLAAVRLGTAQLTALGTAAASLVR